MNIGRRIYYDSLTGDVLVNTGERQGNVVTVTVEQDIQTYTVLSERNRDTFSMIELDYGRYAQDFAESINYRVNLKKKELEFSYPNPNDPEVEQPYKAPLSEQVASNTDYLLDIDYRLIMVELGM